VKVDSRTSPHPTLDRANVSFIGTSQTFIVVTYRMKDRGDIVFLESSPARAIS
jgi:hypothetical protein